MGNKYYIENGELFAAAEKDWPSKAESLRARYGLYETMLLRKGKLELADKHWQRLWKGMQVLGFERPETYTVAFFEAAIDDLSGCNEASSLARVRLQIYAEGGEAPYKPGYVLEVVAIDPAMSTWKEEGLRVGILEAFQKPMIPASNCKISHSIHIPLALEAMQREGWDDVLLLNTEGRIIESAIANLFWLEEGQLYTPPLSEACLEGTLREHLLEVLAQRGIRVVAQSLSRERLAAADELFLTNGIRFIRWVAQCGDKHFDNRFSRELYKSLKG